MTLADLESRVAEGLQSGPPGPDAHLLMSPHPRPGWEPGLLSKTARTGAALLLVYPHRDRPHVLLTVRHGNLPDHAGQVSLPGGEVDPGETLEQAAVREAEEEVGVDRSGIRVLGRLTPLYIPVSRFNLHTVVGVVDARPDWKPSHHEVDRVLEVPLSELTDSTRLARDRVERPEGTLSVPYYRIQSEKVWGATAMILTEFLALLDYRPVI